MPALVGIWQIIGRDDIGRDGSLPRRVAGATDP
jgi:hypothetical protein